MDHQFVTLTNGIEAAISADHRFTTDSVLLARFASPRSDETAAEFCCGCGAVSLLWFGEGETRPRHVTGFELMEEAVGLFELSIAKNGLNGLIDAVCCDLKDYRSEPRLKRGGFDLVVCNPPYFEKGLGRGARKTARQEAELDIYGVCRAAGRALRYGGRLCVSFRPQRLPDLFEAMRQSAIEPKTIRPVLAREGERPHLLLVEGRRGGRPQLNWLPALVLYGPDGGFSGEYREIYRMR